MLDVAENGDKGRRDKLYVFPTPEGPRRSRFDLSIIVMSLSSSLLEPRSGSSGTGGEFKSTASTCPGNSSVKKISLYTISRTVAGQ